MFSNGMIFQLAASTMTNSAPNVDTIITSSRSSLLKTFLEKPETLLVDFEFLNSSIVLQMIMSASFDSKMVLNPLPAANFGSILRILTSFNSDKKTPNLDLATVGLTIISLVFVSAKM